MKPLGTKKVKEFDFPITSKKKEKRDAKRAIEEGLEVEEIMNDADRMFEESQLRDRATEAEAELAEERGELEKAEKDRDEAYRHAEVANDARLKTSRHYKNLQASTKDSQVPHLRRRVMEQKREIRELKNYVLEYRAEVDCYDSEFDREVDARKEEKARADKLAGELESERERNANLRGSLSELRARFRGLRTAVATTPTTSFGDAKEHLLKALGSYQEPMFDTPNPPPLTPAEAEPITERFTFENGKTATFRMAGKEAEAEMSAGDAYAWTKGNYVTFEGGSRFIEAIFSFRDRHAPPEQEPEPEKESDDE